MVVVAVAVVEQEDVLCRLAAAKELTSNCP